ncbi:MAG: AAA family ATPase [Prevotellaceae bacterium]|jgi:predicted AAA+ superfamily ATPase|nr:AAA family ATPase [Prevotellaceae bacterium]
MERLIEIHQKKLQSTNLDFIRSDMNTIPWNERLIGIKGSRGVGKTTLLLQYAKKHLSGDNCLYVSLDNIWFGENHLVDLADRFAKRGGTHLLIDEVHKYPNWSQEIKNIYDDYPELKVVFTGSSLLSILNKRADLSRRALSYNMKGLSFREYLNMTQNTNFPIINVSDILKKHEQIAKDIVKQIKPLQFFDAYLKTGYYPFFKESEFTYYSRIQEIANMIIEVELPLLRKVEVAYSNKLKQLLFIIAQSVPFIPNIVKLAERIGVNRNTLLSYLHYMDEAELISNIFKQAVGVSILQKPDKIFLENPSLVFALSMEKPNVGNLRETFFVNQLTKKHKITYTNKGDFLIDEKFTIEVGGKNKTGNQIQQVKNAFIALDDIEYGYYNRIPLWLFGFLY